MIPRCRIPVLSALLLCALALPASAERAVLHTSMGDIEFELFPDAAPKAVENFLTHARDGYYDGVTFHRVEEDFIIQTGDPDGSGYGGKSIWGAGFENEIDPTLAFDAPYMVAMANRSAPNTNQSQFFFTLTPAPWMTGNYTIFGRVTSGQDVVEAISDVDVEITRNRPIRDITVNSIDILSDGSFE